MKSDVNAQSLSGAKGASVGDFRISADKGRNRRGRKPKTCDLALILRLKENGLPLRKIAEEYERQTGVKVNYATISRLLHKSVAKFKPPTSETNYATKLIPSVPSVVPITTETTPPLASSVSLAKTPESVKEEIPSVDKEDWKGHHIGFNVYYDGSVKNEGKEFLAGNVRNPYTARKIKTEKGIIDVRPKVMSIWIEERVLNKASTTIPITKQAEQIARQLVVSLALRQNLAIKWSSFKQIQDTHGVSQIDALNTVICGSLDKQAKEALANTGIVAGDGSHEGQLEITKNTDKRTENIRWMIDDAKNDMNRANYEIEILRGTLGQLMSELRLQREKLDRNSDSLDKYVAMNEGRIKMIAENIAYIKERLK